MAAFRVRIRLLSAAWLLLQAVWLAAPLSAARQHATGNPADCVAARVCPMQQPNGTMCPMHREASGRATCRLTAACSSNDAFLGAVWSLVAMPPQTPAWFATPESSPVAITPGLVHRSRTSPPESPPPRA